MKYDGREPVSNTCPQICATWEKNRCDQNSSHKIGLLFEKPSYGRIASTTALNYVQVQVLQEKQKKERNCLTVMEHLECLALLFDIYKSQCERSHGLVSKDGTMIRLCPRNLWRCTSFFKPQQEMSVSQISVLPDICRQCSAVSFKHLRFPGAFEVNIIMWNDMQLNLLLSKQRDKDKVVDVIISCWFLSSKHDPAEWL